MRLSDLSAEAIAELNLLAAVVELDIADRRVTNSVFYKMIRTESELYAMHTDLSSATMLLVARIAATSPLLHTVDMTGNNLGEHGSETAAALATIPMLHTVYMVSNNLGEHGPK